jgi:hypothetical protein
VRSRSRHAVNVTWGGNGDMDGTTRAILRHVESLGYVIKVFTINGTAEIHAVPLAGDREPQVVRCNDGEGP